MARLTMALVGTIGTAVQGSAGGTASPLFGTGETRVANNLLVLWVSVTGIATLPATPAGWSIAKQQAGTSTSATVYYKIAAGSDAAPVIALIASGTIAAQLGEYTNNYLASATIVDQTGGAASTTSPATATFAAADKDATNLWVAAGADFRSAARTPSDTWTGTNITAVLAGSNNGTSSAAHYSFAYDLDTSSNAGANTAVLTASVTTSLTGLAVAAASFRTASVQFGQAQCLIRFSGGLAQVAATINGSFFDPFLDTLTRTVVDGLGNADNTDTWVYNGTAPQANSDVNGSAATVQISVTSGQDTIWDLNKTLITAVDIEITYDISIAFIPSANVSFNFGVSRTSALSAFSFLVQVNFTSGSTISGTVSANADIKNTTSVAYTANTTWKVKGQYLSTSQVINVKFWDASTAEPSAWSGTLATTAGETFKPGHPRIDVPWRVITNPTSAIITYDNLSIRELFTSNGFGQAIALIGGTFTSVTDTFTRSVTDALGTADTGGAYTFETGTAANFDVNGSAATGVSNNVNQGYRLGSALLPVNVDISYQIAINKSPTTTTQGFFISSSVASSNTAFTSSGYKAEINLDNTSSFQFTAWVNGSGISFSSLPYIVGDIWQIKAQYFKLSTHYYMRCKVYKIGTTEPAWAEDVLPPDTLGPGHAVLGVEKDFADAQSPFTWTVDNISIQQAFITRSGQAQVKIAAQGSTTKYGQAQADIKAKGFGLGQSQAQIYGFDVYSRTVLTKNPYAYWRLDDANSATTALDVINRHDLSYTATGITYQQNSLVDLGNQNKSVKFTAANSGKLSGAISGFNPTTSITIMGWAILENNPSDHRDLIAFRNDTDADFYILQLSGQSSIEARVRGTDVASAHTISSWTGNPGDTYFFALVLDSGTALRFYVNGIQQDSQTFSAMTLGTLGSFTIGGDYRPLYANTTIDEVAVFNGALTSQDIYDIWYSGSPRLGQAQASIKAVGNGLGQSQADIKHIYPQNAQSQADIKATGNGLGQTQSDIKATNNGLGQAQATVRGNVFSQTQADIKATNFGLGQAQSDIKVKGNGLAQTQADIKAVGFGLAQSQADIKSVGNGLAQSQADIKTVGNGLGQTQADIRTVGNGLGQAQSDIKAVNSGLGQTQADIKAITPSFGQAQASILGAIQQNLRPVADIVVTNWVRVVL